LYAWIAAESAAVALLNDGSCITGCTGRHRVWPSGSRRVRSGDDLPAHLGNKTRREQERLQQGKAQNTLSLSYIHTYTTHTTT
jgi:hypothetical protein